MSAMSDYLEWQLSSHIFGSGTFLKPSVIAIALASGEPLDAHTGSTLPELPNQGAYARQSLNPSSANWTDPTAANGIIWNLATITFPVAASDWGWVSGVGICSSATYGAGNMYVHGALTVPKQIGSGDQFIINISGIALTFA